MVPGPFCGSVIPAMIQSTGNSLLVRFQADFFTEAKGFRAYWTTDPSQPVPTEPPTPPNPWDNIPIGNHAWLPPLPVPPQGLDYCTQTRNSSFYFSLCSSFGGVPGFTHCSYDNYYYGSSYYYYYCGVIWWFSI